MATESKEMLSADPAPAARPRPEIRTAAESAPHEPTRRPASGRPGIHKRRKARYLPVLIIGMVVVTVASGTIVLVRGFLNGAPNPPKQVIQQVQLIRPPPPPADVPPPPPPPPEEKVDLQDPQQQPDPTPSNEPPPSEQLGLDAAGSAGGDAFGLAARPGGRDITGVGGSAYTWYAGLLKDQILGELSGEKAARSGQYSLIVRVWVRDDGSIGKVQIVEGSGDRERDRAIETALGRIPRLSQAPPADMPEPINLRIVSRG